MSNSTDNSPNSCVNPSVGTFPGVTRTPLGIGMAPRPTWTTSASTGTHPHGVPEPTEPIEWAKFCMWLRGYLNAVEGRELTAKDSATIMEKLATVDPDSQLIKVYDNAPDPRIMGTPPPWSPPPYNPPPPYDRLLTGSGVTTTPNVTWRYVGNADGDR